MIGFSISAGNQGSSSAHRWVLANYTEWRKTTTVKTKNSLLVANHPRGGEIMFTASLMYVTLLTTVLFLTESSEMLTYCVTWLPLPL